LSRRGAAADCDSRRRRLHGQHATHPDVADLIAAWCIRSASDRVLDPSCGAGDFLMQAAARLRRLGGDPSSPRGLTGLTGVELDPVAASEAARRLPGARIECGDFLALSREETAPWPRRGFDAVVGNPPYVRQELLTAARKRELSALSAAPGWPKLGGRCDLHARFWAPAIDALRPGGRLGWVVSSTWLDAAYGAALRAWLARTVRIVALVESDVESWFDAARVRTVVVLLEKRALNAKPSHAVRCVRLGRRLRDVAPESLPPDERARRFADLAARLEGATEAPPPPDGVTVREVPQARLSEAPWGSFLRASDLCRDLIALAGDRLVPLEEVATVRWGIKTGDDAVFFPRAADAASLERALLRPAVFSSMELDRLVVSPARLPRRLLLVDTRRADHRALLERPTSGLAAWLRGASEARATHRRPTVAARERPGGGRRWFELRPGSPGAILWSIMHQYRHLAPLNTRRLPVNDNLLLVDPRPGVDARLLAALLNSHVQALLKQAAGRRRNEGMLKTQAADVRRMLVPDPRRLSAAAARQLVKLFDPLTGRRIGTVTQECGRSDRRRLDKAVLRALGVPAAEAGSMNRRLAADLTALHARERCWESDAVARRRRRPAAVRPAGVPG
jgi:hypothetical protein